MNVFVASSLARFTVHYYRYSCSSILARNVARSVEVTEEGFFRCKLMRTHHLPLFAPGHALIAEDVWRLDRHLEALPQQKERHKISSFSCYIAHVKCRGSEKNRRSEQVRLSITCLMQVKNKSLTSELTCQCYCWPHGTATQKTASTSNIIAVLQLPVEFQHFPSLCPKGNYDWFSDQALSNHLPWICVMGSKAVMLLVGQRNSHRQTKFQG